MMIAFWSTAALLLAGALLFVLPPLGRPPLRVHAGPSPLGVYREQRVQIDAELAQGAISTAQHAQAVEELEARVLDELGADAAPGPVAASARRSRAAAIAVALLLPAGALALYATLGKPAALEPPTAAARGDDAPHTLSREQMEEMVEQLAVRLEKAPGDAAGWHMLARSYVAFGRLAEAAQAYDRAAALSPRDPAVLADYADTLAMVNGRRLEGRPTELVNAALLIDPAHPKSLSLAGTAAFDRGDFAAAIGHWQRLQSVLPAGSPQAAAVGASIAQAQAAAAKGGTPAAAIPAGRVAGTVSLAEPLKARVAPGATLFVFARPGDGSRVPLAIRRVPASELPYRFELDDSLAMSPQSKLSAQRAVVLGARISRSGNATPQSGDLTGTIGPVPVGARDVPLVIDEVVR